MLPYQLIFPDYKDAATGKTLVVTPGSACTVIVPPDRGPLNDDRVPVLSPDAAAPGGSASTVIVPATVTAAAKAVKKNTEGA